MTKLTHAQLIGNLVNYNFSMDTDINVLLMEPLHNRLFFIIFKTARFHGCIGYSEIKNRITDLVADNDVRFSRITNQMIVFAFMYLTENGYIKRMCVDMISEHVYTLTDKGLLSYEEVISPSYTKQEDNFFLLLESLKKTHLEIIDKKLRTNPFTGWYGLFTKN